MKINSSLSDHSLVLFDISIKTSEDPEPIVNPYDFKIFEYDFSKDGQAWEDFYDAVNSFDVDSLSHLQPEEQLDKMYSLIEVEAEKYLDKKHSFRKTGEKDKFIPDNVRKMLRRKLKLSKRFMASDNWLRNHETIQEIEKVESKKRGKGKEGVIRRV